MTTMCQRCGREPAETAIPDGHGDQLRVCPACQQALDDREQQP